ncbi:MAG: CYTH domain-containing protein [Tannerellaceae bacterium]|jgi:CYTH domain-containing protein|nr:CYTH domain-containing protein [Tannerellaceae bacterium]
MIEIERKFTVVGDFRAEAAYSRRIAQGYICADHERVVRVRIAGDEAFLTIKGPSDENHWSRYEFEQKIAPADAAELMKLCVAGIIDKTRHYIPGGKHLWEVDEFHGENEGLLIAEIELASENETFDRPSWLGEEVTSDPKYYNAMLSQQPYSRWEKE